VEKTPKIEGASHSKGKLQRGAAKRNVKEEFHQTSKRVSLETKPVFKR